MKLDVSSVWIEDRIAHAWEDLEHCLEHLGLALDVAHDAELLTSAFWVSYYNEMAGDSRESYEAASQEAQALAARLHSMLPAAIASTIQTPLASAVNSTNQARYFLSQKNLEVALSWTMSATKSTGLVLGIIGAANSDELSAETHRAVRRDAAILGHAKNHQTKAQAIELYRNGNWPSKDKAAEEIAKTVNRAFRTVRSWLTGV